MSKLEDAPAAYTFDDFVLVPQYSEVGSRRDPDITSSVKGFTYSIPIVASPMNTVTEAEMLVTMAEIGAVGVLHRYMDVYDQVKIVQEVCTRLSDAGIPMQQPDGTPTFYVAVGANGDVEDRVRALSQVGVMGFCVDVANGHNEQSVQAVRAIRRLSPSAHIMAGNVCTYGGAHRLAEAGANSIRVGIGPGSNCTTRQVTAHGVPQLSAIEDCARIKEEQINPNCCNEMPEILQAYPDVAIIADGGIKRSGDIIKALAIGADAVMLGSLLAGTKETPGEVIEEDGRQYKYYHGMASNEARSKWKGQRIGVPEEGVSRKVPYYGKEAKEVVLKLAAATQVGLSFSGALTVEELRERARWRRVSGAGYTEGTPHGK